MTNRPVYTLCHLRHRSPCRHRFPSGYRGSHLCGRDQKLLPPESGQPGDDGFKALEKLGLKSVLNLREYHSDDDEAKHTAPHLYRFKLAVGKVSQEDLINCLLIIHHAPKPILIHCWHGSDRTGIVCAAYRIVMQNWSPEKALAELLDERFGHHRTYYSNLAELIRSTD